MADSNMAMYQIVHIPDKEPYPLHRQPTENVIASVIDPKHANNIIRMLNRIEPLENLRHVKRVQKKILEAGLMVVMCALLWHVHVKRVQKKILEAGLMVVMCALLWHVIFAALSNCIPLPCVSRNYGSYKNQEMNHLIFSFFM